jgi:hypothetical protein
MIHGGDVAERATVVKRKVNGTYKTRAFEDI